MADPKQQGTQKATKNAGFSSQETPKSGFQDPGLRHARSTSVFRMVNFELYAKPNKFTMILGVTIFLGCIGTLAYMNIKESQSKVKKYNALNADGVLVQRERRSKWE